jgi:hypothetical protein
LHLGAIATIASMMHQLTPLGWMLIQSVLLVGAVWSLKPRLALENFSGIRHSCEEFLATLSPMALAALLATIAIVIVSAVIQFYTPIYVGDEKMYHASRVIYWIQHQSVFPYPTHNDRQTVFTFGSELFFLWPVLLSKSETLGRLIFWLGYPFAAIGEYLLLRALKASKTVSLVAVLLVVSTPIVLTYSTGLKPEMWAMWAVTGTAFWACRLEEEGEFTSACFWMGVFAMLTVNIRTTATAIIPVCAVLPFLMQASVAPLQRGKAVLAGLAAGLLLSGIMIPLGFNMIAYHHFFGPPAMQKVHLSDISADQIYTHLTRAPFLLFEIPEVPGAAVRQYLTTSGNSIASAVGASNRLPGERDLWPGLFSFTVPEYATRFSLLGMFWLPALVVAILMLLQNLIRTAPKFDLTAQSAVTALAAVPFVSVLLGVRWMVTSAIPERLLILPYALGAALAVVLLSQLVNGVRIRQALALLFIVIAVYPASRIELSRMFTAIAVPITSEQVDAPFTEALANIPAGSHILFAGGQGVSDYPLFAPRRQYANQVILWGKAQFEPQRMRALIDGNKITHVLIENDHELNFHWDPPIPTGEMVQWLSVQPDLHEIHVQPAGVRLFSTAHLSPIDPEQYFKNTVAPPEVPILRLDPSLQGKVGIVTGSMHSAWGIENVNGRGFAWMGHGREKGIRFALWSRGSIDVQVRYAVVPGPSRADSARNVEFIANEGPPERRTFSSESPIAFTLRLKPGENRMELYALDDANKAAVNDMRDLIVGIREIAVTGSAPVSNPAAK